MMGVEDVLAGTSGSLLDHPNEFNESRNAVEVILTGRSTHSKLFLHPLMTRHRRTEFVSLSRQHPITVPARLGNIKVSPTTYWMR
jgi:hypothetical protein